MRAQDGIFSACFPTASMDYRSALKRRIIKILTSATLRHCGTRRAQRDFSALIPPHPPLYSPGRNPIETAWSKMKSILPISDKCAEFRANFPRHYSVTLQKQKGKAQPGLVLLFFALFERNNHKITSPPRDGVLLFSEKSKNFFDLRDTSTF